MPDIATQIISLGSSTALIFIILWAAIRYFPNALGLYSANQIDQREHTQKSAMWLQQKEYRVLILLLMANIKQAGNESIDMMSIFKLLINDDIGEQEIQKIVKEDKSK